MCTAILSKPNQALDRGLLNQGPEAEDTKQRYDAKQLFVSGTLVPLSPFGLIVRPSLRIATVGGHTKQAFQMKGREDLSLH